MDWSALQRTKVTTSDTFGTSENIFMLTKEEAYQEISGSDEGERGWTLVLSFIRNENVNLSLVVQRIRVVVAFACDSLVVLIPLRRQG